MFTGLIEALGVVRELAATEGGAARLVVDVPFGDDLAAGESVAVDGCCLTALPGGAGRLVADLSPETLARTTLGSLAPGRKVHVERALQAGSRLGGHVVLGHVDGAAVLVGSAPEGEGMRQRWALPPGSECLVASKGSLSIDGVSLTVAALGEEAGRPWVEVALVPHTLASTTLGERRTGESANLELDAMAKHVVAALESSPAAARPSIIERASTGAPWESRVGYCRAVRAGSLIFVSGTAPVADDGTTFAPGDMLAQARRCFAIVREAVERLGGPGAVVVRTRMYVTDIARWEEAGRAHAEAFGHAPPATTMLEVRGLIAPDMLIEVEADAVTPDVPPGP